MAERGDANRCTLTSRSALVVQVASASWVAPVCSCLFAAPWQLARASRSCGTLDGSQAALILRRVGERTTSSASGCSPRLRRSRSASGARPAGGPVRATRRRMERPRRDRAAPALLVARSRSRSDPRVARRARLRLVRRRCAARAPAHALDDVADHVPEDAETRRLRAEVVVRRNGRDPDVVTLRSRSEVRRRRATHAESAEPGRGRPALARRDRRHARPARRARGDRAPAARRRRCGPGASSGAATSATSSTGRSSPRRSSCARASTAVIVVAEAILAAMVDRRGLGRGWRSSRARSLGTYVLLCDRLQFHHNRWALACYALLLVVHAVRPPLDPPAEGPPTGRSGPRGSRRCRWRSSTSRRAARSSSIPTGAAAA